jgi:hypothetical protein
MTHVLTTQELQNLIPETKQLDGINFADLKILITEVIKSVELSGVWEFVQYVQGKPSLFVVRQLPTKTTETSKQYKNVEPIIDEKQVIHREPELIKENKELPKNKTDNSKMFSETSLPWKK